MQTKLISSDYMIWLPVRGAGSARPEPQLIETLGAVSSTALHSMGIRQTFIQGITGE